MQCVRCAHPLPPRADRCLRCFALNPQNRPDPLPAPTPATPLGAVALSPLGLSFESDPPPARAPLAGLSFESDPPAQPARTPAPDATESKDVASMEPELAFQDPSLAAPPRLVIDLRSAPGNAPAAPDTEPAPPPSWMEPPRARGTPSPGELAASWSEPPGPAGPAITPAPLIDLPPASRPSAPSAAAAHAEASPEHRSLAQLAEQAVRMSDPDLPLESPFSLPPEPAARAPAPAEADAGEPALAQTELAGFRAQANPRPPLRARLTAWALDGALVALASLLFVALAAAQAGRGALAPLGAQSWESWADALFFAHRLPLLWALLGAALAVGYSWLFIALGGRTPGLRLAGLRVEHEDGTPLDPIQSLARASLALASALPALFGFLLALVDPRGQTLHDKLSRALLVSAEREPGSG